MIWTSSSGEIELTLRKKEVYSVPTSGAADKAVAELLSKKYILAQLVILPDVLLVKVLSEYGAWDDNGLSCRVDNLHRLLWIACLDLQG